MPLAEALGLRRARALGQLEALRVEAVALLAGDRLEQRLLLLHAAGGLQLVHGGQVEEHALVQVVLGVPPDHGLQLPEGLLEFAPVEQAHGGIVVGLEGGRRAQGRTRPLAVCTGAPSWASGGGSRRGWPCREPPNPAGTGARGRRTGSGCESPALVGPYHGICWVDPEDFCEESVGFGKIILAKVQECSGTQRTGEQAGRGVEGTGRSVPHLLGVTLSSRGLGGHRGWMKHIAPWRADRTLAR